jgi:predicted anti-sigma-YlaC factor YlaD
MTIKSGGAVLFGDGAARTAAGNYVSFVLWFNFVAGFAYIAAGVGLFQRASWAPKLAAAIAVLTIIMFAAFGVYILNGGAFEQRTVGAMSVRSVVWVVIAILAYRFTGPSPVAQTV